MEVSDIIKKWKRQSRVKAIRENCMECSGDNSANVTLCPLVNCPLWGYRFGNTPTYKAFAERMELAAKTKPEEFNDAYSYLEEESR